MDAEEKREFPWHFVAGGIATVLIVGGLVLFPGGRSSGPEVQQQLPFGEPEKAYAERIAFSDIKMSRASNLLDQEITFVHGVLENRGARVIRDIEITIEFRDLMNQVVLRETLRPFGPSGPARTPLQAGRGREFHLNLESVPPDWNRKYPTIRVTGLLLE